MTGISLAISTFAICTALYAIVTVHGARRALRERTAPPVPPRHAVVRNPAGARQQPRGTMHQRDRIPIQVPPEVEAENARTIEHYGDDDLLITPFVQSIGAPGAGDDTAVMSAVP